VSQILEGLSGVGDSPKCVLEGLEWRVSYEMWEHQRRGFGLLRLLKGISEAKSNVP
jgi:hypothetical protein